jgi:transcriptional regulator of aromatic amino acid metabolism
MNGSEHLVILAIQKRLVRKFRESCATVPRQATTLEELGLRRSFLFKRMEKKGIFRIAEGDRYYLDEDATEGHFRRAKIGIFVAVGIALIALLVYLFFGV